VTHWPDIERLIDCLEAVETGGTPEAERDAVTGDGGAALGRLQIHRIMVDECNRIMRRAVWTYADRSDRQKSRDMCGVYLRHWGERLPAPIRTNGGKMLLALARLWNGGPQGWLKPQTVGYSRKVLREWGKG
jgi:hypothetical protein